MIEWKRFKIGYQIDQQQGIPGGGGDAYDTPITGGNGTLSGGGGGGEYGFLVGGGEF